MNFAIIKNKARYRSFFIPFRLHLIILIIAMVFAWRWLQKINVLPDTSFTAIAGVFITVVIWFIAVIFFFAFITSFIPWLLFLFNQKHQRVSIEIKTGIRENMKSGKQEIFLSINPILKPVFGYIRLRLRYDDNKVSDKFSLLDSQSQKLFPTTERGIYRWPLADIKEYKVSSCIIYFEDMFQFFSFATTLSVGDNFITQPQNISVPSFKVQPKKTEDINTRIDRIRKVEGEFLNYKNFENNDDVRRIVWKIYAKNKELVVRIPETNDPYASHIYYYASFYNALKEWSVKTPTTDAFLNHFKTIVWNCFYQLSKQNALLKYIPDQDNKRIFNDDPLRQVKLTISTSNWHQQKNLQQYFKKEEGSVLCISSVTDQVQLENSLNNAGKDLVVVFVVLSNTFSNVKITDWIKWFFIKPAKDSLQNLRTRWNFSPFRRKMMLNEKNIINILNKSGCEILIL